MERMDGSRNEVADPGPYRSNFVAVDLAIILAQNTVYLQEK